MELRGDVSALCGGGVIKSRFIEMFGDPIINPKGYKKAKLNTVLNISKGSSPRPIKQYLTNGPDGVNWIKIGDAEEGSRYISRTAEKIRADAVARSRLVKPGDFLLSNSMSFGRPYILSIGGCIHDGWLVFEDPHGVFDQLFLYELLSSASIHSVFESSVRGGVVSNLNKRSVGNVEVPVPHYYEQEQFGRFVSSVDKLRFDCQR